MVPSSLLRLLVLAAAGALAGAACVVAAFAAAPGLTLEMDRNPPRITTSGFHPVETSGDHTFAWTAGSAVIRLPGLDRRNAWKCIVRVRGGRGPELKQPTATLMVDGIAVASVNVTNEYQALAAVVPPQPARPGLTLTIHTSDTFVPGPSDRRQLGIQVDRVACLPAGDGFTLPTGDAMRTGAISGAAFGAAFGLLGITLVWALSGTVLLAIAQALPLTAGTAPYGAYQGAATWLAVCVAGLVIAAGLAIGGWRRQPVSAAARFVIAFSAGALFLQLLALLHPSKPLVDALFHAHRLEWVLGGRYFFTQIMPDGVRFPYAIGLYVTTAPWTYLTSDYVTLLRVVVSVAHVAAGAMLYPAVVRAWGDRAAGAFAVVLYHAVPLPYVVIGNANMTFAFGQSIAFMTVIAAAALPLGSRAVAAWLALFLLASLAFLSHVGVFPILACTLVTAAALYWWLGGPDLRAPACAIVAAATLAAIVSVVSYYGQFGEAYETLNRVRQRASGAVSPAPAPAGEASGGVRPAGAPDVPALSRPVRLGRALSDGVRDLGWPTVLLAAAGLWHVVRSGVRDRLGLALAAWGIAYAVFVLFSVVTPVEPRFQRYTDEFISRVHYATLPAVVILAGRGAAWGWAAGAAARIAAGLLVMGAVTLGVQRWSGWLD